MVHQGDFEVQLVEAETKTPFPEHHKDGKHYVEVEPDAEYLLKIRRTGFSHGGVCLAYYWIDGQRLQFQSRFCNCCGLQPSRLQGLWSYADGVSTTKALKFSKPRRIPGSSSYGHSPPSLMGKVEVRIYEGIFQGMKERGATNTASSFTPVSVDPAQGGSSSKKKNLRSAEGSTSIEQQERDGMTKKFAPGALLEVITLNYCATPGLMEVGVLPKVDLWTAHRMVRGAEPVARVSIEPEVVRVPHGSAGLYKEVEMFDLTGEDSDNDEESSLFGWY